MDFNNLDELAKYLKNNQSEIFKNAKEDYFNVECPVCKTERKVKNLRNDESQVECTECGARFTVNLDFN